MSNETNVLETGTAAGEQLKLEILRLNSSGEGVASDEGLTVFVPGILPGETALAEIVKVSKNYARARPLELLRPSPDRVSIPCPVHIQPGQDGRFEASGHCGGCVLQDFDRQEELNYKRKMVEDCLGRIGGLEATVQPVTAGSPYHYRNKMAFSLTTKAEHLAWGLRSLADGSETLPLPGCEIAQLDLWETSCEILDVLDKEFGTSLVWDGSAGAVRSVMLRAHSGRPHLARTQADRASLDSCVIALFAVASCDVEPVEKIVSALSHIDHVRPFFSYSDPRATGVYFDRARFYNRIPGQEPYWGECLIKEEMAAWHSVGPWSTLVGPTNFLQVNDEMAAQLYNRVLDLPFEKTGFAVDVYCGVGILTRALADRFERVMGIELDPQAIKLARTTARRLDDCRVEWVAEAAESVFGASREAGPGLGEESPDLVILDPPRKGCQQSVLKSLLSLRPTDIVYISCHPAALARDLKALCKSVYRIDRVEPFDLFPQTHHVETLVHLKRK